MTRRGVDVAWARPSVAQLKAIGATFVARYFSNDDTKDLHGSDVTAYRAAGLDTVAVWETTTGRARAGRAAGVADAQNADGQRKAAGLPADMVLHFAVDEGTSWSSVAPYFAGVASVIGQARTGVYGGYAVIEGAAAAGYRYLWQTVAWSGGRWSAHATIRQTGETTLGGSADWDTAMADDFGQYPRPLAPQEADVNLSDKATARKGVWTDTDQTASVSDWLTLGNLKAGAAAEAAREAADGVKALATKAGTVTLTDAQVAAVADRLAGNATFVQNLATALGKDIAARMQS